MLSFCGLAKRINAHGKAKSKEEGYEEEWRPQEGCYEEEGYEEEGYEEEGYEEESCQEEGYEEEGCQEEGYEEEGRQEERAKETLIWFSVNPRAVAPKSRRVRNERTIFQKATEPNLKWGVPSTGRLIFFG